ncbi:MAG: aldehyde dehydrogenase [Deltaproteobacteria bacterium]|nr:aldehyde dehydrogenase [Deltaproteobacteria bacterium]
MVAAVSIPQPTQFAELDKQLARLKEQAGPYARLSVRERQALLREMKEGVVAVADEWVRKACDYKGIDVNGPLAGEEWLAGPFITVRNFRLLEESLGQIASRGQPEIPDAWIRHRPNGALAVQVFPASGLDKMLFAGITAEVFLKPGVTAGQMRERQASFYKRPDHTGKVSLILGAGNVSSIPPTDLASKLFLEGKVCILKMNPVNAYVGPLLERAFKTLIDKGYLAVCYGGAEVGKYLVEHAAVDEIHITGSDKTHDAMVWGPPGPDRAQRMARNEPLLKKEITSELGNVSPVIVVPGPYSKAELDFQAANIAGAVTNNGSFNCNAAKLLVQPKGWSERQPLMAGIEQSLRGAPLRKAYYPGAADRWAHFTEGREKLVKIGEPKEGELPWTLIPDVDASKADDVIFREEPFCSILSETAIGSDDPVTFLQEAVNFVNQRVWGTLNATIIIHPRTLKNPAVQAALDQALEDLRYGAIGVNLWPASIFALGSAPWGGAPGSPLTDIQSGRGWVHNSFMIEDIEKCVARAPITQFPKPLWFPGHKTANEVGKRLVQLERNGSWLKLPGVALNAMRG